MPLYDKRGYALYIEFHNGAPATQAAVAVFNTDSSDWQFVSKNIIANADYTSVKVYIIYNFNVNRVWFDGIQLYKEEFGTSYQYDAKGNVTSTASLAQQNSKFEYNGTDDLVTSTDPKGNQFKYEYDDNTGSGKHNLTKATSAENVVYSFTYDSSGNPKTAKVGDGSTFIQSSATYTPSGNYVNTMTDALGNTTTYNNDEAKNTLTSVVDPKGNTTNYGYDTLNRLTSVSKNADGQTITNSYGYKNDRIDTITHNGFNYNFGYDSLGNNTTVAVGNQNLITNSYESRTGKFLESTYGNGQKVSSDYDSNDKVTAKKYNGDIKYSYQYDGNNNLAYHKDLVNGTDYRYIYDMAERISKIKDASGNIISYEYDNNNNLSKLTDKINNSTFNTSYSYDKDNKAKEITLNGGEKVSYGYDAIARLKTKIINTGAASVSTSYDYLPGANGSTTAKVSEVNNNGNKINYTYDQNGNIKTVSQNGKVITYTYNEINELKREDNQVLNKTISYSYDVGGNITQKTEYAYTANISLGTPLKTINYTFGDSNWKDKLTSYDGNNITYDQIGNPLICDGYTYTWEQGRQLKALSGNGKNLEFKYNDAGIRTEKEYNGVVTKYHLVGDKVTYEDNYSNNVYNNYKYNYSQNTQYSYYGFDIPVNTGKSYTYSFDAYISLDAGIAWTGSTFIANAEDGFGGNFYYDNTKKGTWQHFEFTKEAASGNARILLYPTTSQIPTTTGYIIYKNVQFKEAGTDNNLFTQATENNDFSVRGNGVLVCTYNNDKVQIYNDYKYNYSQNTQYSYHGFNVPVNTGKAYTYSFDAYISPDANITSNGSTFIANAEDGFGGNFYYDNTKKGTWQHFEFTKEATSGNARILLYPTTSQIPATTGYIIYKNVQFKEVGTGNNLFTQPSVNNGFLVRGSGNFECNYNNDLTSIYYTYDSSAHLVSMNLNGVEYYYIRNAQGDIIGLFDKSGSQVVSYTYDTWGKLISIDGSLKDSVGVKNSYRYRGYRYDTETGLYYLQSRYYNPEWGRFINADGIIGQTGELLGHNLFSYCKNNPVNMSDKSGFRPIYTMGEETEEMAAASVAVVATAVRSKAPNASSANKATGNTLKQALGDAGPGIAASTFYSLGENCGKYVSIGKTITKMNGAIKVSSETLGIFEHSFKRLGIISLAQSLWDNTKYGMGIGIARSAIDVLGFIGTAALVSTFAASGGLAAVAIGLIVGGVVEVGKWGVTAGIEYISKKE